MLTRAIEEYKEYIRISGVLEDKAQKVAVASGAFLAAGLGLLTSENARRVLSAKMGLPAYVLLFLIIALLIAATAMALRVTWLVRISLPSVAALRKSTSDILQLPEAEQTDEMLGLFYGEQAGLWIEASGIVQEKMRSKSDWLIAAQTIFAAAILCIAILLSLAVYSL